ncbi:hypothetical protein [Amycolatopsis sp. H20-H5]|nr:hypothetical protein [Amycolatopsis sp. H20-H5]MEC3981045.1 hypothetical protein [Amycolatopsis sp. H20-H5]
MDGLVQPPLRPRRSREIGQELGQYAADTLSDKEAFLRAHVAGLADTIGL